MHHGKPSCSCRCVQKSRCHCWFTSFFIRPWTQHWWWSDVTAAAGAADVITGRVMTDFCWGWDVQTVNVTGKHLSPLHHREGQEPAVANEDVCPLTCPSVDTLSTRPPPPVHHSGAACPEIDTTLWLSGLWGCTLRSVLITGHSSGGGGDNHCVQMKTFSGAGLWRHSDPTVGHMPPLQPPGMCSVWHSVSQS